jgi:hypothetical protein
MYSKVKKVSKHVKRMCHKCVGIKEVINLEGDMYNENTYVSRLRK